MATRNEIKPEYKWDLSVLYADEAAFRADCKKAKTMIAAFGAHEKKMCKSAQNLYAALEDVTTIERLLSVLYQYAALNYDTDTKREWAPMRISARSLPMRTCGSERSGERTARR